MDITIGPLYAVNKVAKKKNIKENRLYRGRIVGIRHSRSRDNRLSDENKTSSKTLIIVTNSNISKEIIGKTVEPAHYSVLCRRNL